VQKLRKPHAGLGGNPLRELVRTNDAVLVSAVQALLDAAHIHHLVLDQNMSVLEGSIGVLPRRVLVDDDDALAARRLLEDAGLGHELRVDVRQAAEGDTSEDAVLGGRLRLRQPRRGHRVGHDAILLAAATAARPGERAVELGSGIGAGGLALAARVRDLRVALVEVDPQLCALAAANARANQLGDRVEAVCVDIAASGALEAAGLAPGSADRVLMNPPFNDPQRQNVSPDAGRRLAHAAAPETLALWIAAAARLLAPDGQLTLIWRADGLADVLQELAPAFGGVTVLPVHSKSAEPAIRVLVRATKGSRAPLALLPALVLNDRAGRPTDAAEAVLRQGAILALAEI
jgi:tRNA1(Val) A37 N6-methylase TrmN6